MNKEMIKNGLRDNMEIKVRRKKQVRMYESVWRVIADYKKIMNISEALDGDEVDMLCEDIKDIINRNEGNV
mgnify:CR=1 FL=1